MFNKCLEEKPWDRLRNNRLHFGAITLAENNKKADARGDVCSVWLLGNRGSGQWTFNQ